MLSRFKAVNESVLLADDMPTSFYLFYFILFYSILFLIIDIIVTGVVVTKVRCY